MERLSYKYLSNVLDLVQARMEDYLEEGLVVVDATLGNGNDSYKLLQYIGAEGRLYGFDIQEAALENSRKKLEGLGLNNYKLILDSHEHMGEYIREEVDYIIYNLGYLPGGDKSITTQGKTTIKSIDIGLDLLRENGLMNIVAYWGHDSGKLEKDDLEKHLSLLDQKQYHVIKHEFINQKNNPPILYEIERTNTR